MGKVAKYHFIILTLLSFSILGCGTYYTKSKDTEKALLANDYEKAREEIESSNFLGKKRNALLYYLELGRVNHLDGKYKESTENFKYVDFLMDQYNSVADFAVGMALNPAMQPYRTEPHEQIIAHYYNALNYLYLNNTEEAVVEARKINLREQAMFVAAKEKENKYSQDPFGLMMMGMIYESDYDFNNALIAYRNAYETYQNSEISSLGVMPNTLPGDIIRTAKLAGINHGLKLRVEMDENATKGEGGELILFWENGLAPVKMEKNFFFTLVKDNKTGTYLFTDAQNIIQIPIDYNFDENSNNFSASDIGIIRLAYAYYVDRMPTAKQAFLKVNNQSFGFQLAEPISQIAFQIERDNYFKELGKRLLRLAIKKLAEIKISKENEYLGLAVGIANASTEKADTRNWQSIPNEIQFARIPLNKGENKVAFKTNDGRILEFTVQGNGGMIFKNVVTP
ncbi:hypothetical protein DNU06_09430 [Putridiphycobacter roseus]|uniref:Lipoprotein n=1 Tax=Putridiphycobacter roseus TaxID=2219161 RepID=A0A2W1NMR7_9FLAO|nr:hypothetical protein [Putridiphycobacter roseus]PZE16962.1 hypothetical protein DNU06_09430 [Putridiphycobacter roseus]